MRVQRSLDPRPAHELIAPRAHQGPARREHRHRSARPQQHANVDRLGRLAQQLAQQHRRLVADDRKPRSDAPPRDQHTAPRGTDRLLEHREVRRAVDQHLDRVARPRRRITRRPQAPVIRRRPLRGAPQLAQPANMVSARQTLDPSSGNAVGHSKDIHRHHAQTIRRPIAATSTSTARPRSSVGSGPRLATHLPSITLRKRDGPRHAPPVRAAIDGRPRCRLAVGFAIAAESGDINRFLAEKAVPLRP